MKKQILIEAIDIFIKSDLSKPIETIRKQNIELFKAYINLSSCENRLNILIAAFLNQNQTDLENILETIDPSNKEEAKSRAKLFVKLSQTDKTFKNCILNAAKSIAAPKIQGITEPGINKIDLLGLQEAEAKVAKSAHEVKPYVGKDDYPNLKESKGPVYFIKQFNESTIDSQRKDAIAEIAYANIWRFFIGERASESLLVTETDDAGKEKIVGLASRGLKGFKPYAGMLNEESLKIPPGFISVLFYTALLMEYDLHKQNIGTSIVDDEEFFSKIDHDYIVAHLLEVLKSNPELLDKLAKAVAKNSVVDFLDVMDGIRFNPTHKNSPLLIAAHKLRGAIFNGPNTATSSSDKHKAQSGVNNAIHLNEFQAISDHCKQGDTNVEFVNFMSKLLKTLKANYPNDSEKAIRIVNHFIDRVTTFQTKAMLYGELFKHKDKYIIDARHLYREHLHQLANERQICVESLAKKIDTGQITTVSNLHGDKEFKLLKSYTVTMDKVYADGQKELTDQPKEGSKLEAKLEEAEKAATLSSSSPPILSLGVEQQGENASKEESQTFVVAEKSSQAASNPKSVMGYHRPPVDQNSSVSNDQ
ncbi:hypothetical protein L3V79_02095 [Thiotrichales bacterium 19S9-12]|nr:hypothetical protein [Thiotrichales bacterium 19S9-11]MCF6811149.1 hypothetical protein [Thiotrichales bacterium 19S9-12]